MNEAPIGVVAIVAAIHEAAVSPFPILTAIYKAAANPVYGIRGRH
jgi:hypothetical protein